MLGKKNNLISVDGKNINILSKDIGDYISLTDMANSKDGDGRAADIIKNWIRNRATLEFLSTWEQIENKNFKVVESDHFKSQAGLPSFVLSASNWIEKTNAIGIVVKLGKYGGTYAHKDIAFAFGGAISPIFQLYLIKEYQRLKDEENKPYNLEWNVKRILSKINYNAQTQMIKEYIIPHKKFIESKKWIVYAEEADLLNMVLFGKTAKEWRDENPEKKGNIRDYAPLDQLVVLINLEITNAEFIRMGLPQDVRIQKLHTLAKEQINRLEANRTTQTLLNKIKKQ